MLTFKQLPDEWVRDFREYAIPTIEIDLDDETSLDEIVDLFVDINQQGEKVKRFDIVKAIGKKNKVLQSVLHMVAQEQTRANDKYFKKKDTAYTRVLSRLQIVQKADDNQKVDRMWERLFEIVLFNRTGKHRQPSQILKTFIKAEESADASALKQQEKARLQRCFNFLDACYAQTDLGDTRLARDLPHFYTMITTLLSSTLLDAEGAPPAYPKVRQKLLSFAQMLAEDAEKPADKATVKALEEYRQAATKQTTHPGRRATRQQRMLEIMAKL